MGAETESISFLQATRIFEGLTQKEYERIDQLLEEEFFSRGAKIFEQGDPANKFYLLRHGFVKIVRESAAGRSTLFDLLGPGDLVGTVAVLKNKPFPARAITANPCTLLSMGAEEFMKLKDEIPQILPNFSRTMSDRLMDTREMHSHGTDSVEARIVQILLSLAKKVGRTENERLILPRIFTRQDVADMVGTTVETTIRVLSAWKKDGFFEETDDELLFGEEELESRM